jgi:multicomponent K+:H+ antiporter subunit D
MSGAWIIMPVAVPSMTAALLVLALRGNLAGQRVASFMATLLQLAVAIGLFFVAADGESRTYLLGNWPAPFGIVLVLDRLAATMLLLTAVLALAVLAWVIGEWDRRGRHFHALFQFQLLGLNGAFLTGDLFNLFVFFEVLLIASYGLMLHGQGPRRLRAGFHYIAINLVGSTVFLFAAGTLYATTGTLNMADLAIKVPQVGAADQALLAVGALLLLAVFTIKSAMVPLQWWLPPAYGATSPASAALFAIMTKVGAYSIIRVYTLVFGAGAGALAGIAGPWILYGGLLTLVLGAIGVLAGRNLGDMICHAVVASMGTLLIAIGLQGEAGLAAALYYTVHSTLTGAALFLLAGLLLREQRGEGLRLRLTHPVAMGLLYLLLAMAMVGLPPLPGFLGKVLILDAARGSAAMAAVWAVILGCGLLLLVGFARTGIRIFWTGGSVHEEPPSPATRRPLAVVAVLVALVGMMSLLAGPLTAHMEATARQLFTPAGYVAAVMAADEAEEQ